MTRQDTDDVLRKCRELRKMERDAETIELLDNAIRQHTDARLFYSRGVTFYLMDQPEKAVEDLTSAISLDETNPKFHFKRGCILSHILERDGDAIHDFQHVLDQEPGNVEALHEICLCLLVMGRPNRALEHVEVALELAPNDSTTHFCLGESYMSLERFDEAVASFTKATELDSSQDHYSTGLARALERQGGEKPERNM